MGQFFLVIALWLVSATAMGQPQSEQSWLVSYVPHPQAKPFNDLIARTYSRLGIDIRLVEVSADRRLLMLNRGMTDADVLGRAGLSSSYPNLLRVDPAIVEATLYLLCHSAKPCTPDILTDEKVQVFGIRGAVEEIRQRLSVKATLSVVDVYHAPTAMIQQGRADYVLLIGRSEGLPPALQQETRHIALYPVPLYHHIHRRHAQWQERISNALKQQLATLPGYSSDTR
ncbi:hypothetical protein LJ739_17435 [Aestuariibacter halophilus]|uniref:Solute-binding protein family 3/N-terminal domain-containing protein n=1 Tax=Fluctibacter halophilus TaxID=226011 RepID=A0ABS8GCQ8_9ALTE|nr:hypothetical protein [Aestuariibacter halophilus]MCC2618041.1 hypothetical protein [Aestuariibacter halophilus]